MTSRFCLFILLLFYPANSVLCCLDDQCRELEFPAALFFYGERLVNHEIKIIEVIDKDSCKLSCYIEHNCVSINFEVEASSSGKHCCVLNKATHTEHEKDLVKAAGYIYHGTKASKSYIIRVLRTHAAKLLARTTAVICQSGFTSKGSRCLSTSGFIGHECEHGEKLLLTAAFITSLAVECTDYLSLTSGNRKITYGRGNLCDKNLNSRYRLEGDAGTRMPTSCPPMRRCSTDATGWLNDEHPTVAEGKVTRQVCVHWSSNCCKWTTNNCGSFFVYYFTGTPACHLRYCGTD